ncbi:MAG: alginate export family protein, partial [Gemmatimonas sp.]
MLNLENFGQLTVRRVRAFVGISCLLGLCVVLVAPTHAQSAPRAEFKNLRFEEVWPAGTRSSRWDDAIKSIPLVHDTSITLTIGGQARWREEFYRDFNLSGQHDTNGQSRLLLSADLQAGNRQRLHARVFAEARDAQSYGRTLPGGARPTDADRHDVQNLFADVAFGNSFLRYGRQEIALNRERLFGVPDWANTRRGSQGTRLQLVRGAFAFDAIDARPVVVRQTDINHADSTARFRTLSVGSAPGASPVARGLPATWQAYWYEQVLRAPSTPTRRLTSGARSMWQWGTSPTSRVYSFEVEGAWQSGHAGTRRLDGWFWVAESQIAWRRRQGAPTLAFGVEEASGERASTAERQEAFAVLYPAAHAHGGYADVLGRANLRELHLITTWDPYKPLALRAALYRFDRLRTDDGVYTKQNTVFRAAGGSTEHHAADELDITATWRASRHWRVIGGGGAVVPGAFLKHTAGSARTERWGFA